MQVLAPLFGKDFRVVRGLRRPDSFELVFVHAARGPSLADAVLERIEVSEILAQRAGARLLHQPLKLCNTLFDLAQFFVLLLRRFAVAQESSALGEMVEGAAEVVRRKRLAERAGPQ